MASKDVRAAVGGLVIETTWLEFLAPHLVALAGDTNDEWALLEPQQKVFKRARKSAAAMQDPSIRQRTVDWLKGAESCRASAIRSFIPLCLTTAGVAGTATAPAAATYGG
ncbi:MAG TPA: hypothetical protein VI094_05395 [Propionibacteriaceae bacterium]